LVKAGPNVQERFSKPLYRKRRYIEAANFNKGVSPLLLILYTIFGSVLCYTWEATGVAFCLLRLRRLAGLSQNFSYTLDQTIWSNGISGLLVFLSSFLCFVSWLAAPQLKTLTYNINLLLLLLFLTLAFSSSNLLIFYVFFEASLIPTLILILGWGYQPERLMAGRYMILYTVGASLPLLLVLISWGNSLCTIRIALIKTHTVYFGILVFVIYGAFLVKLPIFSLHLWLPKAHVEAPLAGSIILAGILLKLGGYGLFIIRSIFRLQSRETTFFLVRVGVWGGLIAIILCLRQTDVKAFVAYSSIGHIRIVIRGIILGSRWGVVRAVISMVAHGFTSSSLFCLAYYTYTKSHTRRIPYIKGVLRVFPTLSFWWFLICCINMAAPITLNLVSELLIIVVLWVNSSLLVLTMAIIIFVSASYNIYLYCSLNHGGGSNYLLGAGPLNSQELLILSLHFFPFLLLLKIDLF